MLYFKLKGYIGDMHGDTDYSETTGTVYFTQSIFPTSNL